MDWERANAASGSSFELPSPFGKSFIFIFFIFYFRLFKLFFLERVQPQSAVLQQVRRTASRRSQSNPVAQAVPTSWPSPRFSCHLENPPPPHRTRPRKRSTSSLLLRTLQAPSTCRRTPKKHNHHIPSSILSLFKIPLMS